MTVRGGARRRDGADRIAAAGYTALVPDLYRGKSTVEAEEAHHLMSALNFGDAASQDVRGAVQSAVQKMARTPHPPLASLPSSPLPECLAPSFFPLSHSHFFS